MSKMCKGDHKNTSSAGIGVVKFVKKAIASDV